jgi:hypothetical protein
MATTTLSQNRATQRLADGNILGQQEAVYRSPRGIQSPQTGEGNASPRGLHKVSAYTAAEIKVMANVRAAMHRDELIADAKAMIAKSPELTKHKKEQRHRAKLSSDAQKEKTKKSITSAIQLLGAE